MTISQTLTIKTFVFISAFALLFALGFFIAQAQEAEVAVNAEQVATDDAQATELVKLDENIKPEDLGVGDPALLPDSPLYGFKNAARGFRAKFRSLASCVPGDSSTAADYGPLMFINPARFRWGGYARRMRSPPLKNVKLGGPA